MLSERLIRLRKLNKKTQQYMADKLGITRPAYTAYESGSRKPDYETLEKIANIFDTSIDYLLGRVEDPVPLDNRKPTNIINDPNLNIMFRDLSNAPPEIQEETRKFLEFLLEKEKNRKPGDRQGE